jgi:hypothetical protein
LKCRRDPGRHAGDQGDAEANQRDPRIQRQVEVWEIRSQHVGRPDGDLQPSHASGGGQHHGFDHEQADQPAPAGADRETNRNLLPALQPARQQEPRDVCRSDQQNQSSRPGQQGNNGTVRCLLQHPDAANRTNQGAVSQIGLGVRFFELPHQPRHFSVRLVNRCVRGQPPDDADSPARPRQRRVTVGRREAIHRRRDPDGVRLQTSNDAVEVLRRDPDHGEGRAVDAYGRAKDVRIFGKASPPEVVTENRDGIASRHAILVGRKEATRSRSQAQCREVVRGHHGT